MMFAGSKFCQHCGAIAAPMMSLDDDAGECPRCRSALDAIEIGDARMRGCSECDGLWMDNDTFENVCADAERRSAVLSYFKQRPARALGPTKINYVPCPDCGQLMNRANFARASGVIIDVCKQHGAWFDADELPAIVEFVQKGGMELARQKQINELNDERARLRTERLDLHSTIMIDRDENSDNPTIRSFVKALFG